MTNRPRLEIPLFFKLYKLQVEKSQRKFPDTGDTVSLLYDLFLYTDTTCFFIVYP
jgi:hypothetical protein